MDNSADNLATQLDAFAQQQLSTLKPGKISQTTAHLILTVSFFTGAVIQLAAPSKTPKSRYLQVLHDFLANTFAMDDDHAAGLVASNARMYKQYVLIEQTYNAGWAAARDWQQGTANPNTLKELLAKYHSLSMSNLHIAGVKEKVVAAPEIEAIIETEAMPEVATPPRKWGRVVLLVVFVMLLGAAIYLYLHPALLPADIREWLQALPVKLP